MTVFLLILLVVAVASAVSQVARKARARQAMAAIVRESEDREYLEACLNRERTHDYPLSHQGTNFEETFWRGWNR